MGGTRNTLREGVVADSESVSKIRSEISKPEQTAVSNMECNTPELGGDCTPRMDGRKMVAVISLRAIKLYHDWIVQRCFPR